MSELRRDPISARWVLVGAWPASDLPPLSRSVDREALAAEDAPGAVLDRRIAVDRDRGTMFEKMSGAGQHELLVEDEREDVSMADLDVEHVRDVLAAWRERMNAFADDRRWRQLAVVKNHGAAAGARLRAPHSEIFALPFVPASIREKMMALLGHHKRRGTCLLCDLIRAEREAGERLLLEGLRHTALAPYASRRPFELMILPKGHHSDFAISDDADLLDLATVLLRVLNVLREALDDPPYNLVLETAPRDAGADLAQFHWHLTVVPRVALAGALYGIMDFNPVSPEQAIAALSEAL